MFLNRKHAWALFGVGVMLAVLCVASIGVAEAFMPDNVHGRRGVLTFYRSFGPGLLVWGGVATAAGTFLANNGTKADE